MYLKFNLHLLFIPGSYSYSSFERREGTNIRAKSNIVVDLAIVLPFTLIHNVYSTPIYTPNGFTDVFNPNPKYPYLRFFTHSQKMPNYGTKGVQ